MAAVRMVHPDSGGEYWATPGQVPHLKEVGWQVAEGQDTSEVEEWPAELRRFGGQAEVRIRHPETGGETVVGADAVPFHRERGWVVVDEEAEARTDLEAKTVPELRELAKERGISPLPATKPDLLAALAGEAPAAEQESAENQAGEPAQAKEDEG